MEKKCLSFHITDLCNSKCTFCVVASPMYKKDMVNYDQILKFIKDHAGQGYDAVNIHGGEPTIHPRFRDTLSLIREYGYPEVHVQTNGVRLHKLEFTQELVDLGVRLFIISLHGETAETQDSQTNTKNGFVRTIEGIRNAAKCGARIRTNTVITKQNVDRLLEITKLAVDCGVHHVNFSNIHPVGSATFSLTRIAPTFAEVRPNLYAAVDYAVANGRDVTLEGFPYCTIEEKEEYHLANEYRNIRMMYHGNVYDYDNFMNEQMRTFGTPCQTCIKKQKCGGVYKEYIDLRGWSEFSPILGSRDMVGAG